MESIVVEKLEFGYTADNVIENLDLTVYKGELVVIVGANGSGKSTFLKLILGELKAKSGIIKLLGEDIEKIDDFKDIGYVPQMNIVNKIPFPITCLELVVLNLYKDFGLIKIPKKRHLKKAKEILIEMDLEKYIDTPFNELSGGLQQRVLISRAMVNSPEILILDEPTAGVDEASKGNFYKIIQDLNKKQNITVVLVTHEIASARKNLNLDKIYGLESGRLRERRAEKCYNLTS